MKTVVAMFDNWSDAQNAVQDLINIGIARDDISLVASDQDGRYSSAYQSDTDSDNDGSATAGGAVTGAAVGGIGGVLLGLGALAIPGIGPVIAAGPLIAGLVGAGIGAAVGGLVGALVDAGVPEEQAGYYAEGVRRGGSLLTVSSPESRVNDVVDVLNQYNPVDINERASAWRQSGWTGFDPNGEDYRDTDASSTAPDLAIGRNLASMRTSQGTSNVSGNQFDSDLDNDGLNNDEFNNNERKVEVVEEDLRIGKRAVNSGGVRVKTHVTEKPVEETVTLRQEEVAVERRPVNRPATSADLDHMRDETIEVAATSEEAVVDKQPRVVEEVLIRKDARARTETVRDTVRRTDVDVEPLDGRNPSTINKANDDYNSFASSFRNDYQTRYANSGYTFEQYEPAYRYGYMLAGDERYRGRDWNAIEQDARTYWSQNYKDSPWQDFKDAVRHSWQRGKDAIAGRN